MRRSRERGDPARLLLTEHTPHDFTRAQLKKLPFPLYDREFLGRYISFAEAGCLTLVSNPLPKETKVDYGANMRTVRGASTVVLKFEPAGDAQCKVTLLLHLDAGGILSERVTVSKIPQSLNAVAFLQNTFERDKEVDGAERSGVEEAVKNELDKLDGSGGGSEREIEMDDDLVPRVVAKFDALKRVDYHVLEHPDFRVQLKKYAVNNDDGIVGKFASDAADSSSTRTGTTMTMSTTIAATSKKKRDDGELVVGSASAVVDAPIERCAAWAFAEAARLRTKDGDGSHRVRCDLRPEDSQSQVGDTAYKLPGGKLLTCT
jgi:hypothetical protein